MPTELSALQEAEYNYDGALADLASMGRQCMGLVAHPEWRNKVAWWLCANYPREVFRHPESLVIRYGAEEEGPPRAAGRGANGSLGMWL